MTWDDALSKTILYLHNLNRYQNPPTTSCLLSFIKRSHIFVGPQPNQTGPLNIAGGLEGEGNDLGSHHTSLETEIHHRQTDRRTDKSWGGEPTSLSVLSLRTLLDFGLLLATPRPLPSLSLQHTLWHLLPPTRTFPLSCSLLSGLLAPGLLGEAVGTFLLTRAPLGPVCPSCGTHTAAPLSLRSGAERCRRIRGGVVYGG